jgi:hypothetical protein
MVGFAKKSWLRNCWNRGGRARVRFHVPARSCKGILQTTRWALVTTRSWWISGLEMTLVAVIAGALTYGLGLAFAIH